MYEPDTILELKQPHGPDEETGEEFPYNKVKVVGPSPINHGINNAEWTGPDGAGVIITPLSNFGSTLDEPLGKLQALYSVVEVPDRTVDLNPKIRVINSTTDSAGPTPEDVFKQQAPGVPPEEGQTRGRTPIAESPLEDPRQPANASPLDAPARPAPEGE
jgi:hypothetical protein